MTEPQGGVSFCSGAGLIQQAGYHPNSGIYHAHISLSGATLPVAPGTELSTRKKHLNHEKV